MFPVGATLLPIGAFLWMPGSDFVLAGEQGSHELSCICAYFGTYRIAHFIQLRRVNFDHHLVRGRSKPRGIEARDDAIETSADGKKKIAILDREVSASRGD